MNDLVGTSISHYTILEEVGRGGMGVVYKARDTKLDRFVALKFLPLHLRASDQDKSRFIQEAKSAAALNHPNVCSIIDIEEQDSADDSTRQIFIVMEFVDGQTLEEKKGMLSARQAIDIGIQIADGLAAAHEKGIVHRDIKPENIMIRKDGIAQIMDFGLAKLWAARSTRLTKEGSTVGTAGYMSPEQVQGQEVDHRSDIFSLGVVLYELFAGQMPFKGVHETALLYEIVNVDPPPVAAVRTDIDPELDRIVFECLQKEPEERYQAAKDISRDLRRFKRESSRQRVSRTMPARVATKAEAEPTRGSRKPLLRLPMLAGIAIGASIVLAALFLVRSWNPWKGNGAVSEPVDRFVLPLPSSAPLPIDHDPLAFSPDGKHLAYTAREGSGGALYVRDMDKFEATRLASADGLNPAGLFFSPDGQWLGFFANGKMMKVSLSGGKPIAICDAASAGQASWGENDQIVFMQTWGSPLWIVSSEAGSTARPLTKLDAATGERAHLMPWVLPGGTSALFTVWTGSAFEDALIGVVDLKTGDHRILLKGGSSPRYLPEGYLVFARGSTLMAVRFDAHSSTISGEPIPVLDRVLMDGTDMYSCFGLSRNGTLVYASGEVAYPSSTITLLEKGKAPRQLRGRGVSIGGPRFSPDGRKISVIIFGPTYQVGVYDLARDILTPLTFTADNYDETWSADGSRVSYTSNVDGHYQIYSIEADGSGSARKLFDQEGNPWPGSWSPDGKVLAYVVTGKETGYDIWVYDESATPPTRPLIATRADESSPAISPDGRWVAYTSNQSGEEEVYVQSFPDASGKWRVSDGGGTIPAWAEGGRKLLYVVSNRIMSVPISVQGGAAGQSLVIGRADSVLARSDWIRFAVSPDGKTIALEQRASEGLIDHLNVVVHWSEELSEKSSGQKDR